MDGFGSKILLLTPIKKQHFNTQQITLNFYYSLSESNIQVSKIKEERCEDIYWSICSTVTLSH